MSIPQSDFTFGANDSEDDDSHPHRRASISVVPTIIHDGRSLSSPDFRRKSMPAQMFPSMQGPQDEEEVEEPEDDRLVLDTADLFDARRKSMPAAMFMNRVIESMGEESAEDVSQVTIKARRVSIHVDALGQPSTDVTLRLRRFSTPGSPLAEKRFSLTASSPDDVDVPISPMSLPGSSTRVEGPSTGKPELEQELRLENDWTFWAENVDKGMTKVGSFNTVQGFWLHWNHIDVFGIQDHRRLCLFKTGIQPDPQDPQNAEGGIWWMRDLPKTERIRFWSELMLLMIGEQLDDDSDSVVCGCVLSKSYTGDVMQLWDDGGYAVRTCGRDVTKPDLGGQQRRPMIALLQNITTRVACTPYYTPHSVPDHGVGYDPHAYLGQSLSPQTINRADDPSIDPRDPMNTYRSPVRPRQVRQEQWPQGQAASAGLMAGGANFADLLSASLDEAHRQVSVAVDVQRQTLQSKMQQISCMLAIFNQVRTDPKTVGQHSLAELMQLHNLG
mmetsp:Transcript_73175/g.128950  ORF Transcript_73175/g.128950 Transcript_73175/m.128950 type:complete len:500 (-) Transcript_73175:1272-2771(-)